MPKRDPQALTDTEHDVVIVGGGAFGCCAAWEAAARGLSVALIEQADFCSGTSAQHLKMVHGGIRYLQHLDLPRVRESMRERAALLRIAPHLVQPLPIVMPTHGKGMEGRLVLRAGLALYDLITLDRNRHLMDPSRRIPRGRLISRDECLALHPHLDTPDLTGAGVFYDAQFYNPPRLAWAFLRSAIDAGAQAANYTEATGFLCDDDRVCGVIARDRLSGDSLTIRAKVVLNSAGPWAPKLLRDSIGLQLQREPTFSRDTGFVVRGRLTGDHALTCRVATSDPDALLSRHGRHVFLVPWRDFTLLGVWHKVHVGAPDQFRVEEAELRHYLDDVNGTYPSLDLKPDDVSMVHAGLILFGENQPGAHNLRFGKRSLLIDHAAEHGLEGLVTMVGVRATVARATAEQAIDLIVARLGAPRPSAGTASIPVHGGDIERFDDYLEGVVARLAPSHDRAVVTSLVHNHGTAYGEILDHTARNPALGETLPGSRVLEAQVVHAVREEMAQKLADVVLRRTDLGSGGHPGQRALSDCARLMATEMGWTEARIHDEIEEVEACYPDIMLSTP